MLKIDSIYKSFSANQVLKGISLDLKASEVTVLMGANGAGKSTLVKIISGIYSADAGEIFCADANGQLQPYRPIVPADAIANGIFTVHQLINLSVMMDLTVAENLVIDWLCDRKSSIFMTKKKIRNRAKKVAKLLDLKCDLDSFLQDLTLAERQMITLTRCLANQAKVLILDEPTSALSLKETERLFESIEILKQQGVAVLYISHRTSDIKRLADQIIVLRDGELTGQFQKPLNISKAVEAMLGQQVEENSLSSGGNPAQQPTLSLKNAQIQQGSQPFNLNLYRGEVVALVGLVGAGQTPLIESLVGIHTLHHVEEMNLNGKAYFPHSLSDAVKQGVFLVAKDRLGNGIFPDLTIRQNMTLPFLKNFCKAIWISSFSEKQAVLPLLQNLQVKYTHDMEAILSLSGGNQQKVMIGRWLLESSHVLILDEPFQGVDILSRSEIGKILHTIAQQRAVMVACAEIDEALHVADRILVISNSTIVAEYYSSLAQAETIIHQMSSAYHSEENNITSQ